jgi:hypothetical protein
MRPQPVAEEDSPVAVTPAIRPRMPWRVAAVHPLAGFRLRVRFLDGLQGEVDLAGLVHAPHAGVFAALSDVAVFDKVRVEHGAVTWPGELDLAPDAMYAEIKRHGHWIL